MDISGLVSLWKGFSLMSVYFFHFFFKYLFGYLSNVLLTFLKTLSGLVWSFCSTTKGLLCDFLLVNFAKITKNLFCRTVANVYFQVFLIILFLAEMTLLRSGHLFHLVSHHFLQQKYFFLRKFRVEKREGVDKKSD